MTIRKCFLSLLAVIVSAGTVWPCTNLIVTKGASTDGSIMVTYSADSHQLYGELYFWPAAKWAEGTMLKIYEWDTGRYKGEIPQAPVTYSVTGNMNEYQLLIGETTFGGRREFRDRNGIMDYGSLIYVTLQRCKTAREAIAMMDHLMQTYGYGSGGESFTIADPNEVWVMEVMAKAPRLVEGVNVNKGAVWVAKRIPDGYICAHANQARITTIDFNDPENCLYSPDVISHAREVGIFSGRDRDFSFSDVYAPVDFSGARFCEARVWAFYNKYHDGMEKYLDYAMGHNLSNRMPLYIKPKTKLSVKDLADMMRDYYGGTPLDMTCDIGAGGNALPYRWRPLTFEADGKTYVNERAIVTQQTGWWYVGQCRSHMPQDLGGLYWFGVDDAGTSALIPIYSVSQRIAHCIEEGNGSMLEYSDTSLFWIFNRVAQFAYQRYNEIGIEVRGVVDEWENLMIEKTALADRVAMELYKESPEAAREYLTDFSVQAAEVLLEKWNKLDKYLMVKYIDGNTKRQNPDGSFANNGNDPRIPAPPIQAGYTQKWKEAVAKDHGKILEAK
ncbi:MAG: dipeptidase [Bacteroidales bacterium]|nr:dipeptidase [Bacteroidales bacterium]